MGIIRKNYTLADALYSDTARTRGINNVPGVDEGRLGEKASADNIIANIKGVFRNCVNPIKDYFNSIGANIAMSSAYRCYELNSAIKGDSKSKHMYGHAVDICDGSGTYSTEELFRWAMYNLDEWHQIIWEFPENGKSYTRNINNVRVNSWLHVDYVPGNNLKKLTLATESSKIKNQYKTKNTYSKGVYLHGLKRSQFRIYPASSTVVNPLQPLDLSQGINY